MKRCHKNWKHIQDIFHIDIKLSWRFLTLWLHACLYAAIFHLTCLAFSYSNHSTIHCTKFLKQCLHLWSPCSRAYLLNNLKNTTQNMNEIPPKIQLHFIFVPSLKSCRHLPFLYIFNYSLSTGLPILTKQDKKNFLFNPTLHFRLMSLHHGTFFIPLSR